MIATNSFGVRLLSRISAVSLLAVALVTGMAAAPAAALTGAATSLAGYHRTYTALGDSFTAGQGAPPYIPGPCLQSRYASYPVITGFLSPYRLSANKACSGADTDNVLGQLAGVDPNTSLVTLTVGGIDAGSNVVLAACAPDPAATVCTDALKASTALIAKLPAKLFPTYVAVAAAMPHARIAVLGYPHLFNPGDAFGDKVNQATDVLNQVIAGAVAAAATSTPRLQFVDVSQEFANHGIGAAIPYINYNPANPTATANFHPNALGNLFGYYRALVNDGLLTGQPVVHSTNQR
ncbi:SGNH/GDSL hydrolase family protein [Arthrobacter sp. H14-L1]|uniref:SGNH/GDSL hydrolase family protein n=1 Tax=Arthrobacter sp. H14-L1 TaxID=2996697 RepID=UPI00226E6028|nr:SGNH/GDSL hydrolase family protein [Arthrobacter sp. H14-L1]MCY0903857.1 SGNH/GDSL hydrolase family protein [Arthrobacter sp. H14-L1]